MKLIVFAIGLVAVFTLAEVKIARDADAQVAENCLIRNERWFESALQGGSEVCRAGADIIYREFDANRLITKQQPASLDQVSRFVAEETTTAAANVKRQAGELQGIIDDLMVLRADIKSQDPEVVTAQTLDALIKALQIIGADFQLDTGAEITLSDVSAR